eukprot:scaffold244119_cov35-Tisochrysis_lutea.AAC.1
MVDLVSGLDLALCAVAIASRGLASTVVCFRRYSSLRRGSLSAWDSPRGIGRVSEVWSDCGRCRSRPCSTSARPACAQPNSNTHNSSAPSSS